MLGGCIYMFTCTLLMHQKVTIGKSLLRLCCSIRGLTVDGQCGHSAASSCFHNRTFHDYIFYQFTFMAFCMILQLEKMTIKG